MLGIERFGETVFAGVHTTLSAFTVPIVPVPCKTNEWGRVVFGSPLFPQCPEVQAVVPVTPIPCKTNEWGRLMFGSPMFPQCSPSTTGLNITTHARISTVPVLTNTGSLRINTHFKVRK